MESTDSLAPPARWTEVTIAPSVLGGVRSVSVAASGVPRFFRLKSPGAASVAPVDSGVGAIDAETGGTVTTSANTVTLVVPVQSLVADTEISIRHHLGGLANGKVMPGAVLFSPDGLAFKTPATLSLQLPKLGLNPAQMRFFLVSDSNPPIQLGSEVSQFQSVTNFGFDLATATVTLSVGHFSALSYFWQDADPLHLVFDIPFKYLKKGDLLYTLTAGGLGFLGTRDSSWAR
ncbi:MAG: hypothetical protein HY735_13140 [Verrucomicrobia bacterium]|nr:hypothetical protein [Verrucomicrobiota bacterium]